MLLVVVLGGCADAEERPADASGTDGAGGTTGTAETIETPETSGTDGAGGAGGACSGTWRTSECTPCWDGGTSCLWLECSHKFFKFDKCSAFRCGVWEAAGVGDCGSRLGETWNGVDCVPVTGCGCVGRDCETAAVPGACAKNHDACRAPCSGATCGASCAALGEPQRPDGWFTQGTCNLQGVCAPTPAVCSQSCAPSTSTATGDCAGAVGWVFDGAGCVPLKGCSCPSCPDLMTEAACQEVADACTLGNLP